MKIEKSQKTVLVWSNKEFGVCDAVLWDDELTSFQFAISGSSPESGLHTNNVQYLSELHKVLGELLAHLKTGKNEAIK